MGSRRHAVGETDPLKNGDTRRKDQAPQLEDQAPKHDLRKAEVSAKLAELRTRINLNVGQVVVAMMNVPRYQTQSLADLAHLVIEPLLHDRVAIASVRSPPTQDGLTGQEIPAGIAIWASVSDDVDTKIREQIKEGVFPIRLASEDWTSGEKLWLLDVIAPNRKLATIVLSNLSKVMGDKPVAVHPIVGRSVDPEALKRMRVAER